MQILANQLSIVVQGEVIAATEQALTNFRARAPQAQIIVSTYAGFEAEGARLQEQRLIDVLLLNPDPGPLPSTVNSPTAGPNNLNRMLVSTQMGLEKAEREYVLKVRSDVQVDPLRVMQCWAAENEVKRLLFASRYTRHPFGINGYLFHVSDWITFGRVDKVRQFWSAPQMSLSDSRYFEQTPMTDRATPTARRFRARMAQEQWICTHYARLLGYMVPSRLAQRSDTLVRQYVEFLARECVICDSESLGLQLPKHEKAFRSLFQRIDCLSESDWRSFKANSVSGRMNIPGWRAIPFVFRGLLSRMVLLRKWLYS